MGLILAKWRTGRQTSHRWSVYQSRWIRLFFSVCLIRNHPHFVFHLLDVCLDKTCTRAAADAKARATLDTQGEWGRGKCPAGARSSKWEGWQNAVMWTEWGNGTESEEEACNIDDKKPLLKFELPAASALSHFVLVLIRIFIITALIHTFFSFSLCSPPLPCFSFLTSSYSKECTRALWC